MLRTRLSPPGRGLQRDRGSAPIQVAIIFPVIILILFGAIQGFTIAWAHNAVATAAREGVSAGRMYGAGPGDGASKARKAAADLGGNLVSGIQVSTAGTSRTRMSIRVRGQAVSLVPGLKSITVSSSASGPIEQWVTQEGN
ncbi:TadE/TadG family type IV pilus assembly protein [Streptomyces sp. NPDC056144]|uniref:TadE/TadG family type IV pilus assembly protein n=1 Tax=unclassified Streptomyces TaxID=2593676 RepID=UPI0035DFDA43